MATKNTTSISIILEDKEKLRELFPQFETDTARIKALLEGYENKSDSTETDIAEHPLYKEALEQIKTLQDNNDVYSEANAELTRTISNLQEDIDRLGKRGFEPAETQLLLTITPFQRELLELVRTRLEKEYQKPISAEDVLLTPFVRYNVQQWTLWFYKFVVKQSEIAQIFEKHKKQEEAQ